MHAKRTLLATALVVGGIVAGMGITGLLFILGVTLVSTVSHTVINPTEWTLAVPAIALLATAITTGGSLNIIRTRHPFSALAVGMIIAALVFLAVIVGYYFGYAR